MENVTACPERRSSALTATITELVCFEKKAPDFRPTPSTDNLTMKMKNLCQKVILKHTSPIETKEWRNN
jgi:hypothetical protein